MSDTKPDNKKEERMENLDGYLVEIFNIAFVLHGELKDLEVIKHTIIEEYHNKNLVKLIKPTYAKEEFLIVDETEWQQIKKQKTKISPDESDSFYLAFILRGKVKYLEEIKNFIIQRPLEVCESIYSKERLFIVKKSQWEQWVQPRWYP